MKLAGHAFETAAMGIPGFRQLSPGLASSGQPTPAHWPLLQAAGLHGVLDLRPLAEQPGFDEGKTLRDLGLGYFSLPVAGAADLTRDAVIAFDLALQSLPAPILAHCASGNRVGALFALRAGWLQGRSVQEALALGRDAGLTTLQPAVLSALASDAA